MNTDNHIKNMTLVLDEPKINFANLDYRDLVILVGANGTGKTMVLKTTWVLSIIVSMIAAAKGNLKPNEAETLAQFVIDKSYKTQTFTGELGALFNNNVSLKIKLHMGLITEFDIQGLNDTINFPLPKFLSSQMRLFDNISMYLKIRKDKSSSTTNFSESIMHQMLEYYPLYDVLYIEGMINSSPIAITQEMNDTLRDSFDFDESSTSLVVDLNECDFYLTLSDGRLKYMRTYGAGHQSVVNMFVGTAS